MQPPTPAGWVSTPEVALRVKTATELLLMAAAYTLAPFGLIARPSTPSRKRPSTHVPLVPVSLTQPAVPDSCVSSPVLVSREKTATASLAFEPTYTYAPSGLTSTPSAPASALPSTHVPLLPVSLTQPEVPESWVS